MRAGAQPGQFDLDAGKVGLGTDAGKCLGSCDELATRLLTIGGCGERGTVCGVQAATEQWAGLGDSSDPVTECRVRRLQPAPSGFEFDPDPGGGSNG
jgi:hypothetical protein